MMRNIKVLITAAGDSSRFWPLENKIRWNFSGRTIIEHSVSYFIAGGFRDFVIVIPEKERQLFEYLAEKFSGIRISLVSQGETPGVAGAVLSAGKSIGDHSVIVCGPSDVLSPSLFGEFKNQLKRDPQAVIAGKEMETYFPGGYLLIENGRIRKIIEKPDPLKLPGKMVTFMFHYFRDPDPLFQALKKGKASGTDSRYEGAVNSLIRNGLEISFMKYSDYWGYLKYPWHVLEVTDYFLEKIKGQVIKNAKISKNAVISGNVYIDDGAVISDFVSIRGPVYIGAGTLIGNNCLIRNSHIGRKCVIGYSTEIARSYIGDNCAFHKNYIGDSVISEEVTFGAGAVTANFRLDAKNIKSGVKGSDIDTGRLKLGAIIGTGSRIGVNVSVMPGVKIGKNCVLSAHTVLYDDLDDGRFYQCRQTVKIRENIKF